MCYSNLQYPHQQSIGYVDSAASDHFATPTCNLKNEHQITNPNPILLSNGDFMVPTKSGEIPNLPKINSEFKTAQVCPENKNATLISLGKLCDDGCLALTDKDRMIIFKDREPILKASRCNKTGMYLVNMDNPTKLVNLATSSPATRVAQIHNFTSKSRLLFMHGALGGPTISTLQRAIRAGYLTTWPELTSSNVSKLKTPDYTILGHLDQKRKNSQSTREIHEAKDWDETIKSQMPNKSNDFLHKILSFNDTIYTDLTGRFSCKSKRGYQYVFITYSYDSNAILARPLKSRKASEILEVLTEVHEYLSLRGFKPQHQILDNEISSLVSNFLKSSSVKFQLVPPHIHRRNAAERAIRTFKNHLITIFCTVHPNFPMNLWCRLLPQAEMTLNMLRPCRMNPRMSAYTALEGEYNYLKNPLTPLGAKVIAFSHPNNRTTWAPHGQYGWTIGPAMDHYRCIKIYVPKTNGIITADTFQWSNDNTFQLPSISNEEQLVTAANTLSAAIRNELRFNPSSTSHKTAIESLSKLFREKVEAIYHKKLYPLGTETVNKSFSNESTTKSTNSNSSDRPRVEIQKYSGTRPRVNSSGNSDSSSDTTPTEENTAKDYVISKSLPTISNHRYPTRLKVAKAANTIQMEQSQIDHPKPVTYQFIPNIIDPPNQLKYEELIKGPQREVWERGMCNELGRLAQGFENVEGRNTIFFIHKSKIPRNKKVTYGRIVCAIRPQKKEKHRVRLTMGGNLIKTTGITSTPVSSIKTIKCHWNSVLHDDSRYGTIDIKDFYLNSQLREYVYMRLPVAVIPQEIMDKYGLYDLECDGFVYIEVRGGMYGHPEAGRLAHDELVAHLKPYGYEPTPLTPGLWVHKTNGITFTLVVDDFGIKYKGDNIQHLINALRDKYTITIDMSGSLFCGVSLEWRYKIGEVRCSMPGYIPKLLKKLNHQLPTKPQYSPHPAPTITYGIKLQQALKDDDSPILNQSGNNLVRSIVGAALFIGRFIDMTLLVACNEIALNQTNSTMATLNLCTWLLDYMSTYPDPSITYKKSDMVLWVSSDSSYQSVSKSRSRVGGYHFLGNKPNNMKDVSIQRTFINAPIHVEASILRHVMGAASESEIAGGYVNARDAVETRIALMEMGHHQPPTPLELDNTTAYGIITKQLLPRRSKAIDMRYYWLRDRENQKQFNIYWSKGENNLADYFTKHHSATHHKRMRKIYMSSNLIAATTVDGISEFLRGCVNHKGLTDVM